MTEVIGTQADIVEAIGRRRCRDRRFRTGAVDSPAGGGRAARASEDAAALSSRTTLRRWPGEGSLLVDDVVLLDRTGQERAVYEVGSPLSAPPALPGRENRGIPGHLCGRDLSGRWHQDHATRFVARDGAHGGRRAPVGRAAVPVHGSRRRPLYHLVSLHRDLDPQFPNETVRYDLLAYSYQFEIIGNPPLRTSLFVLPAKWKL